MLDGIIRRRIDPAFDRMGRFLASCGVSANAITLVACAVGIASAVLIASEYYLSGLFLLLLSRIGDGLDGAIARAGSATDYGGFLDIVLDFVFYGAIPLGFVYANPDANGSAGAALIFSFYINGASFLAYAIMAEKHKLTTELRGQKSLYFTTGVTEATETVLVFALACLFPDWFAVIAYVFTPLCLYTALSRIILAKRIFDR